jgi:transcriptional regulator with XRE-family HTH domain
MAKRNYIKLIFGLKVKQLRSDKGMSLSELASKSGLSVSYLNEIESGKKYPKIDKIITLAQALGTNYDRLVSLKLAKNLAPIGDFLESNILEQLPLDHYGIDLNKLILLMSNSSMQLSALISAFIETAQASELSRNSFSKTALRTYKEFNENYFDELEKAALKFSTKFKIKKSTTIKFDQLKNILKDSFNYKIDESILNYYPEFDQLRAVVIKGKPNTLLLNKKLSDAQKSFVIGKELAFNFLDIKDRSYIHSSLKLNTFDHLLNNFKASYFSTALILNQDLILTDLRHLFEWEKWNSDAFLKMIDKFNSTTEMFFQRITNLSSKFLGVNKFFFSRFNHEIGSKEYILSNELRLNTMTNLNSQQINEHICRRLPSFDVLTRYEKKIKQDKLFNQRMANVCRSKFFDSGDEYLCISVGQRGNLSPNTISCITIGFLLDETTCEKIKFTKDPAITLKVVNSTCERCRISNCKERVAPPSVAEKLESYSKLEEALNKLNLELSKQFFK